MTATLTESVRSIDIEAKRDRAIWITVTVIAAILFLLLENPYWVPGGDSEVYIAAARNMALGKGYIFNGLPAKISPPGWSLVLAGLMKFVSPTFLVLKLFTLSCMVAGLAVFYRVIRRFASAELSGAIILLTAIISHVYSLTFWLHSDALFLLITAITLLLCLQFNEGKRGAIRIVAILILCALSVLIRWAGVINFLLLPAALLAGESKPKWDRRWVLAGLTAIALFGSYEVIKITMVKFAPPNWLPEDTADVDASAMISDTEATGETGNQTPDAVTGTTGHTGYMTRVLGYGTWFSYLLWQPFRMATGVRAVFWIATVCGLIVAIFVFVCALDGAKRRQWLLPAVAVYTIALCVNWPQATARYLVPITPFIVLMIVRGAQLIRERAANPKVGVWTYRLAMFGIGTVAVCNLALYEEELRVMRSSHFADRYEAGLNKSLLAAAEYLHAKNVGNWQTAVNPQYINIGKRRMSPTGLRILTMLTGKAMLQVPKKWNEDPYRNKIPNDHDFRILFLGKHHVHYYLEQAPVSPWRVWHYRMPWLQKVLTGSVPVEDEEGWQLYQCNGHEKPIPIPLPDAAEFPKRVPGL